MRNGQKKDSGISILGIILLILVLRAVLGSGNGPLGFLSHLIGFFLWGGVLLLILIIVITVLVIRYITKDNKYRDKHDPPSVTPKAAKDAAAKSARERKAQNAAGQNGNTGAANGNAASQASGHFGGQSSGSPSGTGNPNGSGSSHGNHGANGANGGYDSDPVSAGSAANPYGTAHSKVADRSKTYDKTPAGVQQMLKDYQVDCILGSVASDALKQKEKLESQLLSYERLVERRFGRGTLSAEKYLTVKRSAEEALQSSYYRIANRMEAFDTREYLHFKSGAYKEDAIPDHVQEQRQELYEENLREMKECLADNEHILAGMDKLMLKLADADAAGDDRNIAGEIAELEQQLDYYRKRK